MAKKVNKKRRVQSQQKQTNWLLIGGVIGIGVIGLFVLLFLSLQEPPAPELLSLETFCQDNPNNCVADGAEGDHSRDFRLWLYPLPYILRGNRTIVERELCRFRSGALCGGSICLKRDYSSCG